LIIALRHDRRRVVLPVIIAKPTLESALDGRDAIALVDTGSTTSGVRLDLAQSLGLPKRGRRPMSGVGGEAQLERYLFRLAVRPDGDRPAFPFVFDDVIGFELLATFGYDALIGMDILSQCDLSIRRDGSASLSFGR
jgi:Aspartyl protease